MCRWQPRTRRRHWCAVVANGLDARRPLSSLHEQWSTCQSCALGKQRLAAGRNFVHGIGSTRTIMFIGDGPDEDAEIVGAPFVGSAGGILRTLLARFGLREYYITNLVACRSCVPQTNSYGKPVMRRGGELMYKDEPPLPAHCAACRPRLNEEIYLVDPTVIVGLGSKACEVLTGRPANLDRDSGEARPIAIPGATYTPDLTDKGHWRRKTKGVWMQPVKLSTVQYHFVPTYHPRDVNRVLDDHGHGNVLEKFAHALRSAIATHDSYLEGAFNQMSPNRGQVTDLDLQHAIEQEQKPE